MRDACHAIEHGTQETRRPHNKIHFPSGTIQSQLSKILEDIHALSRRAQRTAHANARRFTGTYEKHLAALLDEWIAQERGRTQLVCIACAAELGALKYRHLVLGSHAIAKIDDRALRALYWSVSKRWGRTVKFPSGTARAEIDPLQAATSLTKPCVACCELARDNRRSFPHQTLKSSEVFALREDAAPPSVSNFYCTDCSTRWIRRMGKFDLFAAWTISG